MAAHQSHDVSSDDTAVSQSPEKVPNEAPPEPEHEMAAQRDDEGNPENEVEKQPSGEPLDRTPSQAQRMGKKKIILVMGALCVRLLVSLRSRKRKIANWFSCLARTVPGSSRYGTNCSLFSSSPVSMIANVRRLSSPLPCLQLLPASTPRRAASHGLRLPIFWQTRLVSPSGVNSVIYGAASRSFYSPMLRSWLAA